MDVILSPLQTVLIPVVIGLVAVAKVSGVSDRWAALSAVVLGLILAFILGIGGSWGSIILSGIVVGLSACGLYSGVKATFSKPTV
jgi:uncharacterized membrane protein